MSLLAVAGAVGSAIWWQRDGRKLTGHSRTVEKVSSRLQSWQHGIGHQLQHVPLVGHWLGPRGRSQPARQSWQMQEPTNLAGQAAVRRMKKVSNLQHFYWKDNITLEPSGEKYSRGREHNL